jgi:hypothetical protein
MEVRVRLSIPEAEHPFFILECSLIVRPTDLSDEEEEDEDQKKQEKASRFADALSRIGELWRGVPMTLSVEQYLKKDDGT